MAPLYERSTGPKKIQLEASLAPATRWQPDQIAQKTGLGRNLFVRSRIAERPLPAHDADIAFASVAQLSRWIETRQLSSLATHSDLSRAVGALRSQTSVRHHADA